MDRPVNLVHRDAERCGGTVGDAEHVGEFLGDVLDKVRAGGCVRVAELLQRLDRLFGFLADELLAELDRRALSSQTRTLLVGELPDRPVKLDGQLEVVRPVTPCLLAGSRDRAPPGGGRALRVRWG